MRLKDLAGDHKEAVTVAGNGTAGTADEFTLFRAPFRCTITGVSWTPAAAITANGTNYFDLRVRNRTTGAGDVEIARRSYVATNSVAFTPETVALSGTAANLDVAEGDLVTAEKLVTGTGLAMPDGLVQVHYKAR